MIIIQYGMQGSASSWVYNLLKLMLEEMGHNQKALLKKTYMERSIGPLMGANMSGHNKNEYPNWNINESLRLIDKKDILLIKTHSDPPHEIISKMKTGEIVAIITTRDIFDIANSIKNKGIEAREKNQKEFSHIHGMEHALKVARGEALKVYRWMIAPNSLLIPFQFLKSEPHAVARVIAKKIGYPGSNIDEFVEKLNVDKPRFSKGIEGVGLKSITADQAYSLWKTLL